MIGGNTKIDLQAKTTVKDDIGAAVVTWQTVQSIPGWLDLQSGESKYSSYNAKIQESTHVFVADYTPIEPKVKKAESTRAVVNGEVYEVLLIDNPMELNRQLEIYLKYTGGQVNGE